MYCRNLPLNGGHNDGRLEAVAAGIGAGAGAGDLSCHGNPTSEPQARGDHFNSGDDKFVRDARQPQRRESQVRNRDDSCPAAIEQHEIDGVGEGPLVVQSADD